MKLEQRLELLKSFREDIKNNFSLPNFDKDIRFYDKSIRRNGKGFNCYAYALQLIKPIRKNDDLDFYCPGFLTDYPLSFLTKEELLFLFNADLEALGIDYQETDIREPLKDNAYKIITLIEKEKHSEKYGRSREPGFHFIRQNDDATWSHKKGFDGGVYRVMHPDRLIAFDIASVAEISKKK